MECLDLTTAICSTSPGGTSSEAVPEVCDGADNDCDGHVDEELGLEDSPCKAEGVCGSGGVVAKCKLAQWTCSYDLVDGYEEEEVSCDGLDNDCDGQTDEGYAVGEPCDGPDEDFCETGLFVCADDGASVICGTEAEGNKVETCNQIDDDCDGITDETSVSPGAAGCSLTGVCAASESTVVLCDGEGFLCDYTAIEGYEASETLCDGIDNDCDGFTDEGLFLGDLQLGAACAGTGICGAGTVECSTETLAPVCSTGLGGSEDQTNPETCDGVDEDCDGAIDEDFTWNGVALGQSCNGEGACGVGVVECHPGANLALCSTEPDGSEDQSYDEVCDGQDNDCDGLVDEAEDLDGDLAICPDQGVCADPNLQVACIGGVWECLLEELVGYESTEALCDGLDNDCDGQVDEAAPELGLPCDGEDPDTCPTGTWTCALSGLGTECVNETGILLPEVCDGFDNDCDSFIDEGLLYDGASVGQTCDGVGECGAGVVECLPDGGVTCSTNYDGSASEGQAETCNGLDDDCDGSPDNGLLYQGNPLGAACSGQGVCSDGIVVCSTVTEEATCSTFSDGTTPQTSPDDCNGLDDDCDGVTDNTSQCDDGDPCTQDQCNTSGSCKHSAIEGLPCDDGDGCTAPDACAGGKCQPGAQKSCDDNNPCTKDSCAPLTGCVHNPTDGLCADDGDPCTQDLCQAGVCAHPPRKAGGPCVDDGNPCTDDFCQGGSCQHPPATFAVKCTDDGDPCTADVCDKGGCSHQPLGTDALCLEDGDPCTQDVCKAGKCTHPPAVDGAACKDDGKPCTVDSCAKGQCTHVTKSGEPCPDDGNLCTDDVCGSGGLCTHPAKVNQPCEDDGNPCTQDKCQNKLCKHPYSKANCTDNDPCTVTDYCDFGKCKGINMLKCDDGNPCTQDLCATGVGCKHNKLNGVGCTDGNACTSGDKCVNGQCKGQGNNKCDDGNPCTDDTCTSGGGCANKPNSVGCTDDGNPCTQDVCAGGACTHPGSQEGKACGGGSDPCTSGVCSAGVCKQTTNDNVCDDGDACTSNDKCAGGVCKGTAFKSCDDGNPCTQDKCDATGKCIHVPQGQASCIAKSSECPIGICQGGKCVSQPGVVCEAKYKADLCSTVKVPGTCTGSGDCVASSVPPAYTCPGCNGICVKCLIFQFCIPLF